MTGQASSSRCGRPVRPPALAPPPVGRSGRGFDGRQEAPARLVAPPGCRKRTRRSAGFSMFELLIAGVIFCLGLLALAYAYGQGVAFVMSASEETIARQKARETMEGVFTALNTQHLDFSAVCNQSQGSGCIFTDG